MSNQTEWRWADPNGQQRLVHEDELRRAIAAGVVPANAPVWTRGWKAWKPAHDVPELIAPAASGDVPAPPSFVVAAQSAFEGKRPPVPSGPAEPPPPPRYIPRVAGPVPPSADSTTASKPIPPAPISVTEVDAKPAPSAKPPAIPKPKTTPPPLPARAKSSHPPPLPVKPSAAGVSKPSVPVASKPPAPARPLSTASPKPKAVTPTAPTAQPSLFKQTQRPPMGVAPPSEELAPPSGRTTVQVAPAPPPLPRIAAVPPPEPTVKVPPSKYPTLMMFEPQPGSAPQAAAEAKGPEAPIVVPANEPSARVNAVTKPPPWGEGAVAIDPGIPKAPGVPNVAPPAEERPSQAPPRPVELSSSDLTSEAHLAAAVKAPPLAPAERPHGTMLGIGPDALAQNRAALERAASPPPVPQVGPAPVTAPMPPPMPPMSQSDMATSKWAPLAAASAARIHDMRDIAQRRIQRAVDAVKERTKDKPPWVLPVVGTSGGLVVFILLIAVVKSAVGALKSSSEAASASTSAGRPALSAPAMTSAPAKPVPAPRLMTCSTSGAPRVVAPKGLVPSGVEVVAVGGQLALGFAVAAKEAEVALLDASGGPASSMRLRADAPVRRVLALDSSRAAIDADKKGDPLQGRRTLAGSPPIDLGAMDGGIAWAPHGSDKGIKLWSLANPDQRIEALRGVPLASGGYAFTFRQGHTIWFGTFAGSPPAPLGELGHVDGLGPQVGSPAIAASGDRVMVAWSDREGSDSPWGVRYTTFVRGKDQAPETRTFTPPAGGLGEEVMSPGLASLDAGRFLFVWTEGPKAEHQVRGAVLGPGDAFGGAFTASTEGVNAGQGQAAVLPDGKGVVAFLSASPRGKGFEVAATSIACTEK